MKIPKGMTEKEVLEIINKVASRYAHKFRFGYFEADDIRQEAVIIAMEALERYEEGRPLENFLAVHVKNRLNNFKRDKYLTGESLKVSLPSVN
jgi:DNA-directed RNA polymerase specialized sigma24 family protein